MVCALALIASAYLAHAVKAGIAAIGPGQWQAGLSLGLTRWQTLRMIARRLRMMVPSFINQWISLIKDTSLAYIVGVGELTFRRPGQQPQHGLPDGSVPVRGAGLFRVLPGARSAGQRG